MVGQAKRGMPGEVRTLFGRKRRPKGGGQSNDQSSSQGQGQNQGQQKSGYSSDSEKPGVRGPGQRHPGGTEASGNKAKVSQNTSKLSNRKHFGQKTVLRTSSYKPWAGTEIARWMEQGLGSSLEENLHTLRKIVSAADLEISQFATLGGEGPRAAVAFIEGLTDKQTLEDKVLRPLQLGPRVKHDLLQGPKDQWLVRMGQRMLPLVGQSMVQTFEQAVNTMTAGSALLFLEGCPGALMISSQGWKQRNVESPPTETTIHGPKVGFTENIATNVALIRRHVQDPTLRVELLEIGVRSKTKVAIVYIEALARPSLVEEVRRRLGRIDTDYILGSHSVNELMSPGYRGAFGLYMMTERPDRVAYKMFFGKVAILVDGTPDAILVPLVLVENLISMDDYFIQPALASFLRLMRFLGWLIVVFVPSLYVAVMAFNPEVLKVDLAVVLAGARVGVPLNVVAEVLLLELMMELLQEATIRLPSKIGSAATVVGGLIIGQAAAQARLVSNIMVVIVAMTAIASFAFPVYEHGVSWRVVKWINVAAAAVFGLFGIYASMTFILFYLNSLESFGTPYLTPFSPMVADELSMEILSRQPFWTRKRRAKSLEPRELDAVVTGEEWKP